MSRSSLAGLFSLLMAFSIAMAAYSTLALPDVVAFPGEDLLAPADYTAPRLPVSPVNVAGNTTARPNIQVRILIGQIFAMYGGSVRMEITNNDTRALFLDELMFDWVSLDLETGITLNRWIGPKETYVLKSLAVQGPPRAGLQDYQLSMRLLQFRNNRWYRMVSGGDDWLTFTEQSIDVKALANASDNPVRFNTRMYYVRTNDLVDFSSDAVGQAAAVATEDITGGYNMGAVCAVFDWLVENIEYTEDPGGGDVWYSPDETLEMMGGDCEDYAMLLAAMVESVGGQSRVYLTRDHAFAAVYVGNTPGDLENATASIRSYYGTELPVHAFHDDTGYWMVADPLGSFYMGGLAVGQEPFGEPADYWATVFPETGSLHSIDVTGISLTHPLWLDPLMWTGMIIIFGALALGLLLSAQREKPVCGICAGQVEEDAYVCPHCQAAFHRQCAFSGAYCVRCNGPIHYPPPPPAP